MHCEWIPAERFRAAYKLCPSLKQKVHRFWKLRQEEGAETAELEESGACVCVSVCYWEVGLGGGCGQADACVHGYGKVGGVCETLF